MKTRSSIEERLAHAGGREFDDSDLEGIPKLAQRFLGAAIAPGTPIVSAARLEMRGQLKLNRWMRFSADEVLNPHAGYLWRARVAWIIHGADYYIDGEGGMDWKLLGVKNLVHARGQDISRSAAARGAAEAVWIPTALLPAYGVQWIEIDTDALRASWVLDGNPFAVDLSLNEEARVTSVRFDRWGDPENTGEWGIHKFGGEFGNHQTHSGLTIPCSGRVGWYYGTDRWEQGEFFRYEITNIATLTKPASSPTSDQFNQRPNVG